MAPTKLGKYVIKSELGHGAMGVVYLAEDPRLHRPVAIKTMSPNVAGDPDLLKRFYREAESAGQLRHPNIVTIYDIDEAEGYPFIAMEFLEGDSLEKIIRTRKEVNAFRKLDFIMQSCRGLHYAHQRGITHRDVKPANIVVLNDGMVKIVDFGIAHLSEASMTRTGLVLGTPLYMSPEQIRGKPVDARSDIFALGVVLFELLTYQNPFSADNVPTIIFKVLNETPPPLSTLVQNCPPALDAIIAKATAKERAERYQTAEDLAFDLQQQADYLKRHMMEVYVNEGERYMGEGNLTLARESLQKVLEIDSHHDLAKSMLFKVQEQIEIRQAQEKIDQGLRQARQALQGGFFDEAVELLDEVLRLDPHNAQAQQEKQLALEQREQQREIARFLERAEELATAGDLPGTKEAVERLLALNPQHERALQLLGWVRKELAEQERQAQVREFLESAQAYLSGRNFAAALEQLEKAHQLDPVNLEIESLIRSAREGQQKEERKKLLSRHLADIQEAITGENFDLALQVADQALEEFPNNSQVVKLRAQATRLGEVQRKRRYVEQQLQAAREFFQKNDFASAIGVLESTLETVPDDARLTAYLKTAREAQEMAALEEARQAAMRQANELIRARDFDGAIRALQAAIERSGQSSELVDLLQFAREQRAEQQRQEQIRQVVARAQGLLREENFEEAVRLLEQSQSEAPSGEVAEVLSAAQSQRRRYEQRREEILQQALHWLQVGDPAKAVAVLDAAPKAYFKDPRFPRTYAQGREALDKLTALRQTLEQVERNLAGENFREAENLLRAALRTYPDDPELLSARQKLQEAESGSRRKRLAKQLEEAWLAMGRMQFREVIELLSGPDWPAAGGGQFPDLAKEAGALKEEARRRERELAQRQTIIQPMPPPPAPPTPAAPEAASLLEAQKRLREALQAGPPRREKAVPPARQATEREAAATAPTLAVPPAQPPAPTPAERDRGAVPRPAPPQPAVVPPPPKPVTTPAVVAPAPRPPVVSVTFPAREKRTPVALGAAVAVVVLGLAAALAWWHWFRVGYAQVSATPWAQVVSVKTKQGQDMNITGETPLRLELRPGDYVIELKNDQGTSQQEVTVKSGEVVPVKCAIAQEKIDEMVDELVSK
jgi:serine/threonine-protein kinase